MSNTTDTNEQQGEALEPCKWCAKGDRPNFLDEDGTLVSITGRDGILCHAHEEYWWPCLKFGVELISRPVSAAPADKTNTGLHCNGCGILIEGWPNVYRCVTSGCGRIYHYQCLLEHCASDHLCQNCKQSYKPYVLRCDRCSAEAFDCCLSKPCVKCGATLAATTSSPAAQSDPPTIYADGFCARCSELSYPLTRALEKTGVPTGADGWQQTYGPNKVKALDDLHTCLRQLLFALEDGDPKIIKERIERTNMRIQFYAEVYRRLNRAAQDRLSPAAASEGEQELLPNAPEVDLNRKCWASTKQEVCIDPRGCDDRGCQLYADEDYRRKHDKLTSRDIRAELIAAHSAAAPAPPTQPEQEIKSDGLYWNPDPSVDADPLVTGEELKVIQAGCDHVFKCSKCAAAAPSSATAAPKCVKCDHESLFSNEGTTTCKKPVRRAGSEHKSTADTHSDDFVACGCKCEFAEPVTTTAARAEFDLRAKVLESVELERVQKKDADWNRGYNEAIEDALHAIDRTFSAYAPTAAIEEGRAVCDCHTWPTVSEMHDYVEVLERIVRGTQPKHKCKPIARAVMDIDRDWWVGELLEPIPEWPKETHCLHMKTPVKNIWFLCNSGDFEQLMVMGNSVVQLENLEWLKSATKGVELRAAALRTPQPDSTSDT